MVLSVRTGEIGLVDGLQKQSKTPCLENLKLNMRQNGSQMVAALLPLMRKQYKAFSVALMTEEIIQQAKTLQMELESLDVA
jgi:hypothetical protein